MNKDWRYLRRYGLKMATKFLWWDPSRWEDFTQELMLIAFRQQIFPPYNGRYWTIMGNRALYKTLGPESIRRWKPKEWTEYDPDSDSHNPEQQVLAVTDLAKVKRSIAPRDWYIMTEATQREEKDIAMELGLSAQRVNQLHQRAKKHALEILSS